MQKLSEILPGNSLDFFFTGKQLSLKWGKCGYSSFHSFLGRPVRSRRSKDSNVLLTLTCFGCIWFSIFVWIKGQFWNKSPDHPNLATWFTSQSSFWVQTDLSVETMSYCSVLQCPALLSMGLDLYAHQKCQRNGCQALITNALPIQTHSYWTIWYFPSHPCQDPSERI